MDGVSDWISTSKANRILNAGICDRTFRDKFSDCIPWKLTPGGKIRWDRRAVLDVANVMPDAA